MTLITPAVRVLFWKEVRQLSRNRQALVTSALLPLVMQVVVPVVQALAVHSAQGAPAAGTPPAGTFGRSLSADDLYGLYLLPLFVCLSATLAPGVTAIAAVINERERRTMELLVALPVRVTDIMAAKLAATLAVTGIVVLPLAVVDGVIGLVAAHQPPLYVLLLVFLALGGMTCSIGGAAGISMLARDYRTSQQLTGLMVIPVLVVATGELTLLPGLLRLLVLGVTLAAVGGLVAWLVARSFSFERYLS